MHEMDERILRLLITDGLTGCIVGCGGHRHAHRDRHRDRGAIERGDRPRRDGLAALIERAFADLH